MLDVQSGRVDGYISDIPGLEYFIRDKPYFKVVQRIEIGERYSMVLQSFNLFSHIIIRGNITLAPVRVKQMSEREAEAIADDLMQKVGIEAQAEKYPS